MAENFDPYHTWLGIPARDQPPHHYRLLGVDRFEANVDVISNAADRQMAHLRSFSTGRHASLAQQLLNEVSAARVCLLNPAKKQAYDSQLRASQETTPPLPEPALPPAAGPPMPTAAPVLTPALTASSGTSTSPQVVIATNKVSARGHKPYIQLLKVAGGAVAGLLLGMLLLRFAGIDIWQLADAPPAGPLVAEAVPTDENTASSKAKPQLQPANSEDRGKSNATASEASSNSDGKAASGDVTSSAPSSPSDSVEAERSKKASSRTKAAEGGESPAANANMPAKPATKSGPPAKANAKSTPKSSAADTSPSSSSPNEDPTADAVMEDEGEAGGLPTGPSKLAVPGEQERVQALSAIKDTFQEQFSAANTDEGRAALAKLLSEKASEVRDSPTVRYVMLQEGYGIAIQAQDFPLATNFVDQLAEDYDIDALQLRVHLVTEASTAARRPSDRIEVAEMAFTLAEASVNAQRFEDAIELMDLAESLAARARDTEFRTELRGIGKEVRRLQREWQDVQPAMATLTESPDDSGANLAGGWYFCFVAGDWQRGLPMLAKAQDRDLAGAAALDRSNPLTPDVQQRVAGMWWELGEKQEAEAKSGFQQRAAYWYRIALPRLSGLAKSRVEKRLEEAGPPVAAGLRKYDKFAGTWSIKYGNGQGRRYVIDTLGNVLFGTRSVQLRKHGSQAFVDFGDRKLERIKVAGPVLRVEHFSPASSFPNKPILASGSKISAIDPERRQPLRAFEGHWLIKFSNKAERRYTIDRTGNVEFGERRAKLVVKEGDVLIDFRDGTLERVEMRGNELHVEHFKPPRRYPWSFLHYGTGIKQRR